MFDQRIQSHWIGKRERSDHLVPLWLEDLPRNAAHPASLDDSPRRFRRLVRARREHVTSRGAWVDVGRRGGAGVPLPAT